MVRRISSLVGSFLEVIFGRPESGPTTMIDGLLGNNDVVDESNEGENDRDSGPCNGVIDAGMPLEF
jgi:hypothetical protein